MNEKQRNELASAAQLFHALSAQGVSIASNDRPDIRAEVSNRCIGIEVTYLHPDDILITGGSRLRVEEERKKQDAAGRPYFMWGQIDGHQAFQQRVYDKIRKARSYTASDFDELWLLISSQLPDAPASTYLVSSLVRVNELNQLSHDLLVGSSYCRAFLHLRMDHVLFEWSSSERWRLRSGSQGDSRAVGKLWFQELDADWFRDPERKAREEAHKAIQELREARPDSRNRKP